MIGYINQLTDKIFGSEPSSQPEDRPEIKNLIAFGVLIWLVAEADSHFLPEERDHLERILREYSKISAKDMPVVLRAIKEASVDRIDYFEFTREVSKDLPYQDKIEIVDQLFRIACVDGNLSHQENEMIRKLSRLMGIDHNDFAESKIRVKKAFGLETLE